MPEINIDHWHWPQFVLFLWWLFTFIAAAILRASPRHRDKSVTWPEWIGGRLSVMIETAITFTVLYFGGFWA